MIISDVTIKNFKGIEEIKIDFKTGFNLIKGINGKGSNRCRTWRICCRA